MEDKLPKCIQDPANILDGALCNNSSRILAINDCLKDLHLRCLWGFWIKLADPIADISGSLPYNP